LTVVNKYYLTVCNTLPFIAFNKKRTVSPGVYSHDVVFEKKYCQAIGTIGILYTLHRHWSISFLGNRRTQGTRFGSSCSRSTKKIPRTA